MIEKFFTSLRCISECEYGNEFKKIIKNKYPEEDISNVIHRYYEKDYRYAEMEYYKNYSSVSIAKVAFLISLITMLLTMADKNYEWIKYIVISLSSILCICFPYALKENKTKSINSIILYRVLESAEQYILDQNKKESAISSKNEQVKNDYDEIDWTDFI